MGEDDKKASKGFTAEEKAAMRQRAKELKADASKAEGERDVSRQSPRWRSRIALWPSGSMRSSRPARPPSRRRPGTGCPPMPRTARSSVSSNPQRSSRRGTRRWASTTAHLDDGAMWPVAFALKELTAANEARIAALVKQAAS